MKRAIISITFAAAVFAASAIDFSSFGFTESGSRSVEGKTYAVLVDNSGAEILMLSEIEPVPDRMNALRSLVDSIRSWKTVELRYIRAINETDRLQVTIMPSRIQRGGIDLAPALPEGIIFYYTGGTEYDFRIKSGAFIIRLRGVLTSEEELMSAILAAVKDPVNFLAARDPQYAIRRIAELGAKVSSLEEAIAQAFSRASDNTELVRATVKADLDAAAEELRSSIASIKAAISEMKPAINDLNAAIEAERTERKADIATLKDELLKTIADLETALKADLEASIRTTAEQAKTDLDALAARYESEKAKAAEEAKSLQAEREQIMERRYSRIEDSLMATMNKGFFGGPKPLAEALVARILELKKATPAMTKVEIATALKAEKIVASAKEIDIVLAVKLGESLLSK